MNTDFKGAAGCFNMRGTINLADFAKYATNKTSMCSLPNLNTQQWYIQTGASHKPFLVESSTSEETKTHRFCPNMLCGKVLRSILCGPCVHSRSAASGVPSGFFGTRLSLWTCKKLSNLVAPAPPCRVEGWWYIFFVWFGSAVPNCSL